MVCASPFRYPAIVEPGPCPPSLNPSHSPFRTEQRALNPYPVTGHDVAAAISPGLVKTALTVRLDGALRDLARPITGGAAIEIVTRKDESPEVRELIRHDAAHDLAQAVKDLYPDV